MAHSLADRLQRGVILSRSSFHENEALDAIRGIIAGALLSLVVFWLPLLWIFHTHGGKV